MKLRSKYDNQADIPEALRGFYVEQGGKWVLDHDIEIPDVSRLNSDVASERRRRQELEQKVQKWEALGKTDEEIAELIAKHKKLEEDDLEAKGKWDQLKAQLVETHNQEKARLQKQIDDGKKTIESLGGTIRDMLLDTNATAAIAEHSGDPELLMPFVRKHLRVQEVDGKKRVEVLGEDGNVKMNAKGEPITVSELVASLRSDERFGKLFKSSGSSGGGTPPGGAPPAGGGHKYTKRSDFKSEKERAEFVDTYGISEYQKLPA